MSKKYFLNRTANFSDGLNKMVAKLFSCHYLTYTSEYIYYSVLSVLKFLKNLFNCLYTSQFVINEQSMYTQFL